MDDADQNILDIEKFDGAKTWNDIGCVRSSYKRRRREQTRQNNGNIGWNSLSNADQKGN